MIKREIERNLNKYGKFLEPFQVFFLLLLFTLPILAVVNLSPQVGTAPQDQEDVLGITSTDSPYVQEVGGTHQFITDEQLYTKSETEFDYQVTILRREAGIYSKPILSVSNPTSEPISVRFTLTDVESSSTQMNIMYDSKVYILKDTQGERFPHESQLNPGQTIIYHLDTRNDLYQNFNETLQIKINIYTTETEQLPTNPDSAVENGQGLIEKTVLEESLTDPTANEDSPETLQNENKPQPNDLPSTSSESAEN